MQLYNAALLMKCRRLETVRGGGEFGCSEGLL